MLRKLLSILTVVIASASLVVGQNESSIKVKLTDKSNKETIPFANVVVELGGIQVGVATTNIDGEAVIKPLNPGKYNVKATYVGYQAFEIANVSVPVGKTIYLNMEMQSGSQQLDEIEIVQYSEPLIDPDTKSGATVTREEYQHMATKNINSVASTTAGVYQADEGKGLNVRGAREDATVYYVDGVKVVGSAGLPQSSIEQVTTIIGGTPAEYGDATGGIIAVTTRGPASNYIGSVEAISSGLGEKNQKNRGLDAYGYNFVGFSVGGPLWMQNDTVNKIKRPVLGFLLSGEAFTAKDPDPSANGMYQVNPDKLAELEQNPLRPNPNGLGGFVLNSEYLTKNDLQKIKAKNNVRSSTVRLNGKIQYQPTANMGITIGGNVDYTNYHDFVYEYALLNSVNNPQYINNTWRGYVKLTQKFNSRTAKEEEKSSSNIKNAYFTIQGSYAKANQTIQDDTHGDKYFNYGYIGKFDYKVNNNYIYEKRGDYDLDGDGVKDTIYANWLNGFNTSNVTFTPGDLNPTGTAYTSQFFNMTDPSQINNLYDVQAGYALRNGDRARNVYSMWYNTGRQYGGYTKSQMDQYRVFANFSADIFKHAVQAGFEFEQRIQRQFNVTAINDDGGLWNLMRQLVNSHIANLDSMPILNTDLSTNGNLYYDFNRYNDGTQRQIDKSIREKLGLNPNGLDYINVDALDPSMLSLNMFSADDLLNAGNNPLVSYYGYDYAGNKIKGNPSVEDFFNKKDANGNYMRQIGAFQPIYVAGYIQDRFDFRDVKFNVGVRIDRYDANQKVLKDKYLLYEAKTAGEVNFSSEFNTSRPTNVGDDYVVYVDNKDNPTKVVGYRNGDTWYNAQGAVVSDPSVLTVNTVDGAINPYLVDPAAAKNKTISSSIFQDYTPQINVMPRIAFSFPISDVANFFAHYDILTQRPPDGGVTTSNPSRFDPTDYMFIYNNNFINNPALKPQRTTDYEIGFSQVLSEKKNASITMSAFYKEMRNLLQTVQVYDAYPVTYTTYGNVDFGTVKGLSLAYDLRRIRGVQLTANYTLQFADGTGSSSTDGVNLAQSGAPLLRTTHPLDYDQRHAVVLNIDYRFGQGADYTGPELTLHKGTDKEKTFRIFENMGANIIARAGSGTPYTRQNNITPGNTTNNVIIGVNNRSNIAGQINGSNKPWNYRFDLRIDKDLVVNWGKKGEDGARKQSNLNIYLQVLNALNAKNIMNVYRATGSATDDGYLASPQGQLSINNQTSAQSYVDLYNIKVLDPSFYSQARVIRLGLLLNF